VVTSWGIFFDGTDTFHIAAIAFINDPNVTRLQTCAEPVGTVATGFQPVAAICGKKFKTFLIVD
jgi:hypothetical protein